MLGNKTGHELRRTRKEYDQFPILLVFSDLLNCFMGNRFDQAIPEPAQTNALHAHQIGAPSRELPESQGERHSVQEQGKQACGQRQAKELLRPKATPAPQMAEADGEAALPEHSPIDIEKSNAAWRGLQNHLGVIN
jgi:hypothetical protein